MIGQSLVLVCAAVALVSGSCLNGCYAQGCGCGSIVGGCGTVCNSGCGCGTVCNSGCGCGFCGNGLCGGFFSPCSVTDGPDAIPVPIIQAPPITLPTVTGPLVTISTQPIPLPRVIGQRCICTKTIVKPQVIQRQVTVPKVKRYYKRTVTPIVENISYKTVPCTRTGCSGCSIGCGTRGVASTPISRTC